MANLQLLPSLQKEIVELVEAKKEKTFDFIGVPFVLYLAHNGAAQYKEKGVFFEALGHSVHPHFNVFLPSTSNEYVNFFRECLTSVNELKEKISGASVIDCGSGSGVLSFVCSKLGAKSVLGVDNNENAVKCAQENAENNKELYSNVQFQLGNVFPEEKREPFDLVVCNPPWIPLPSHSLLEEAVFDPQEDFLKKFFAQVGDHLKSDGLVVFLYSNFARKLGLQQFGRVEKYCFENQLQVVQMFTKKASKEYFDTVKADRTYEIEIYLIKKQ